MEAKNKEMKKSICVNVINEHSVLARISGLFSARGYNIESLTTAPIPNQQSLTHYDCYARLGSGDRADYQATT